ncbi:hypothetical protein AJ79_03170 [Helicocarpus griseus UAMH5409]|uniref:alpha-1,2-Mannosidase n=1 Tax=Helicocarpus griseus UAMH5409 TaxID=1447875 RepID=A0A2B7Y0E9_9EURO|nr:hypothetical protein AJ79_03170 [Helicocarpus griseus UAMH5409]
MPLAKRSLVLALFFCFIFLFLRYHSFSQPAYEPAPIDHPQTEKQSLQQPLPIPSLPDDGWFNWANVKQRYPVTSMIRLPQSNPRSVPQIQHAFAQENADQKRVRMERLEAVKGNFTHAWRGYKEHAWMRDEVAPISGNAYNHFGGWAATLVDSLDTLWIMGLKDEFENAVKAVENIDFTECSLDEINVFETTIRFLGGFLGAYDISGAKYPSLLKKATELGQMLYVAFDTPNRMPVTRWKVKEAKEGLHQEAGSGALVAEIGSLTLEFTRLSQLTKDPRYFDAVQRIMDVFDQQQSETKIPGLWPVVVDAKAAKFNSYRGFTLGGMADSLYEYLPKQYLLLGGSKQYKKLYQDAMVAIDRNILFRPMTKGGENILFPGDVSSDGNTPVTQLVTEPKAQHLGCFAGGMVGLGAKAFRNEKEMDIARKLVEGCLWGYEKSNMGFMPEIIRTVRCDDREYCPWDAEKWEKEVDRQFPQESGSARDKIQVHHLPPGVSKIDDGRYILRPEAIESIFVLYRLTGDPSLRERAWKMFTNTIEHTITDIAHAGLNDCTVPSLPKGDRMESFWLAETLKYYYLMFTEPDVVSLDEFVLNTEAHPFRWR